MSPRAAPPGAECELIVTLSGEGRKRGRKEALLTAVFNRSFYPMFMGDSYIVAAVGFEELVHFSQGMSYAGGWVKGKKSLPVDWLILKHEQGKERPSWKELGSFRE